MKKLVSVIISVILIISVFSACSKAENVQEEQLDFTIDTHYSTLDTSVINAYEKVCAAVINGEEEVRYNTSLSDSVYQLFYTGFPFYALVDKIDTLPDNSGVLIKYKNDIETHLKLVKEFKTKVLEIVDQCGKGKVSTNEYIFNVYSYMTKNFVEDNSIYTAFDALMNGKGYASAVNSLFEYLVLQGGGKACHVTNMETASMISLVEFNSVWYYFDPASEIKDTAGEALKYFAMDVKRAGVSYSYTDSLPVLEQGDDKYSKLSNSKSYAVNNASVYVECTDEEFVLNFN